MALLISACGSAPPKPPNAVSGPRDALQMGMQFHRDDEYGAASQMFAKALDLYRSVDDAAGQATALVNLADVALVLGEHAQAAAWLAQAERLATRDGVAPLAPQIRLLEAQALAQAGNADAAAALDALLANGAADKSIRQAALLERARVALEANADATTWLRRAHDAVGSGDSPRVRAGLLRLDALSARRAGDTARAGRLLEEALGLYRADLYRPGIAASNEELAALARETRDLAGASDRYGRALSIRVWLRDGVHSGADLDALAAVEESRGNASRAGELRAALKDLRASDVTDWPALAARLQLAGG